MSRSKVDSHLVALDQVSIGGSSSPFNEDATGWTRTVAWVVDGATSLDASRNWDQTSARWMAATTNNLLVELSTRPGMDSRGLIRGVVEGLSSEWNGLAEYDESLLPPAGSLGLVVHDATQNRLELTTVGDCLIVWSSPKRGHVRVLTDVEISNTEKEHGQHVEHRRPSANDLNEDLIRNRRMYMAGERGWIVSTNPRVVESVDPLLVEDPIGDLVLVASDGFARSVALPDFDYSWSSVLKAVWSDGLASVLCRLRKQEREVPSFGAGRYKTSDDASALLLQVSE